MNRRKPIVITTLVVGVVLLAAGALRLSPMWPGPGLPAGATRLTLTTAAPHLVPAMGCALALLAPVRVATSADDLIVVSVESGETVKVIWPSGWAAWRLDGQAELVDRNGTVVAREGDVIHDRFGGGTGNDDGFQVCEFGN